MTRLVEHKFNTKFNRDSYDVWNQVTDRFLLNCPSPPKRGTILSYTYRTKKALKLEEKLMATE